MKILITGETDYSLSKQTINVYALLDPVYKLKDSFLCI